MIRALLLSAGLLAVVVFVGHAQEPGPRRNPPRRSRAMPTKSETIPEDAEGLPHEPAPQDAIASIENGQLKLLRFTFALQQRHVIAKFIVDGEKAEEVIVRYVPVGTLKSSLHGFDEVRAFIDGKELREDELAEKLTDPIHVLVSNKKIDPFFMELIKDGIVVLVMPAISSAGLVGPAENGPFEQYERIN